MKELIPFLLQHWTLVSLLITVLLIIILYEIKEQYSSFEQITPQQLVQLVNEEKAIIIDLREFDLFSTGHITHAKNMPKATLSNQLPMLSANKIVIVVTETGTVPSDLANKLIKSNSETRWLLLKGGIESWKNLGLPLVR